MVAMMCMSDGDDGDDVCVNDGDNCSDDVCE